MTELNQNTRKIFRIFFYVFLCFFIVQGSGEVVKSATRTIQYNGKKYTYTKKAVNIEVNGMKMSSPFGGLILSSTALVPAYYTYKQSDLDVIYQYKKAEKKVILENVDHRIEFPLGQKYAYFDGEKRTIDYAAILVKDLGTNKTCVMVPGRVSAEALGYQYQWDNETVTSSISSQKKEVENIPDDIVESTSEVKEDGNSKVENIENVVTTEEATEVIETGEGIATKPQVGTIPEQYTVKIPKSSNMKILEQEDNYWEKMFTIHFDGDYLDYFQEHQIEQKKSAITKTDIKTRDHKTEIIFSTSKIQAFRVTEIQDAIYIEVGNPKDLYEKVVVIDPGHGGTDPGMTGNGIIEKNKTLEITKAVKKYFDQEKTMKVYYTRLADTVPHMTAGSVGVKNSSMSLAPRYNLANSVEADLFISIHVNSWISSSTNGTETLYSSSNNRTNEWGMSSKELATRIHKEMLAVIGRADRGVKVRNNLAVLRSTKMPAVLIETAFATNKKDAEILNTKVDEMAEAIYKVTVQAFE